MIRAFTLLTCAAIAASTVPSVAAAAPPTCFGKKATIVADDADTKVVGTAGDDVIVGEKGLFWIEGRGGDDRICVGGGQPQDQHTLHGGDGADRIHAGKGLAIVDGGDGRDLIFGGAGGDSLNGGAMGDRIFGGDGNDHLHGDGGHDQLHGGNGDDDVYGYDGNDTLAGGADLDGVFFSELCCEFEYDAGGVRVDLEAGTASAADGEDTLTGFEILHASLGDDTILGSDAGETIYALDGNDTVRGRGGDDVLFPDDYFDNPSGSDDTVNGGKGSDTIHYKGYQPVVVNLARGTAGGGDKGADTVAAVENVIGSWQSDRLIGNAADNYLLGEFDGSAGDDYLDGRGGFDVLDGAPGTDECVNGEEVLRCEE